MKAPGVVLAGLLAVCLYGPPVIQDSVFFVESASGDGAGEISGGLCGLRRSFKRGRPESRDNSMERVIPSRQPREDTEEVPALPNDWTRSAFQTGREFRVDRVGVEIKDLYPNSVVRDHAVGIVYRAAIQLSMTEEEQLKLLDELGADYSVIDSFHPIPSAAHGGKPRRRPSLRTLFRRRK